MFAVIKAGGKQYRVAEDQVLKVEGIQGEPGTIVQLGDVIMLGGDTPQLGSPMVAGASVAAEIISHGRVPRSSPSRSAAARTRGASAATGRISC
jgi:large subunit ribosomal protein L21